MKVQIKSAIRAHFSRLRCFQQGQLLHQAGNNLLISEVSKQQSEFVHLHKDNLALMDFIGSPNFRSIFTAQKHNNSIQICSYSLQNQRKMVNLSEMHNYIPFQQIQSIQLITDEFESSVVFVVTFTKNQACLTLVDMFRLKVVANGFVNQFHDAKVCSQNTYEISIVSKGSLKRLRAVQGAWQVEQKIPKKLCNTQLILHEYIPLNRILLASKTNIYITEQHQILQNLVVTTEDDPLRSIVKLHNGFIVITEKCNMKLFCQEGQDALYNQIQKSKIDIGRSKIQQVQFNKKSEEIVLFCSNGCTYYSRMQSSSSSGKQSHFCFEQINVNYSMKLQGNVATTAGQNYCIISSQKSAQLWDLTRLCQTITLQTTNLSEQKVIKTCAMNPDGHSLTIGYSDRVRFFRILLNKFKQFGQYSVRNTSLIQYSHGGQLVALIYGKGINSSLSVLNTTNLKQIMNFKLGFKPAQVIWNQYDDELFISGQESKILTCFAMTNKNKKWTLNFEKNITFIRFDYSINKILVSVGEQIHQIDSQQNVVVFKPKIDNFDYVFPVQGIYLAADQKGGLYCSSSLQFQKYSYLPLFVNQKFNMVYRKGTIIAYSSIANVLVLKTKTNSQEKSQTQTNQSVILVERQEINKFFEKVKSLQSQLEQLQNSTGVKLQEQKKRYFESLQQNENIFQEEIKFLQNKISEIQMQKGKQQKSNAKVFEQLQTGQVRSVNDLEKVYDMKIKLQKQKYLTLEQQNLQQKIKYQKIIKTLEDKYHKDIDKVRKQYAQKLQNDLKHIQNQKERHVEYKKRAESKFIDLEQQNQLTLFDLQINKDAKIQNLTEKYVKLEREYDSKVICLRNLQQDLFNIQKKYKESLNQIQNFETTIQQNLNKVAILSKQIEKKNKTLQQKNSIIDQQSHQIDGLQKAKYVLSFRTTQVRKQLQPKQNLIQKLKSELFKLDQQYKNQVKKSFQLSQKLQKVQKVASLLKKENTELKTVLKTKERTHNDLCSQIYLIINNSDPKQWNSLFVKVYQHYVQQNKTRPKNHKNEEPTCEQINRHLIHVERSLYQVASGNDKMLKGKQKQVVRKMQQNAELVYDLNVMRKKQNEYQNKIKQKQTQISRLRRQLQQNTIQPKSTRANTAVTGTTRRVISRQPCSNTDWIDLSMKRQSDYLLPKQNKKGRIFSANKTMVWRQQNRREKTKISDMARQLESAKNTIMRQDRMIQQLNQRLLGLPEDTLN